MVIQGDVRSECGRVGAGGGQQVAMSAACPVTRVDVHRLAGVIRNRSENILIIDSRSFIEHNTCHIASAVNVCCSKIVKRRLQQDKLTVKELLVHTCSCDVDEKLDVVVYDQASKDVESLPVDCFTIILLRKLQLAFRSVNFLTGGFEEFQKNYTDLCDDKTRKCPPLSSLSQPCLPIANQGPTRILPFLYLGSQFDALNKDLLKDHNITYELNVSTSCPQPEFVPEGHFMRIPVNDTYSEKLLPYFPEAFNFLDKVREGSGCVLVHCLAGISRSPTIAIAYVMRYLHLSSDDGYRYVKSKRPTISPNFNFLGQLLEYEKQLRRENILDIKPEVASAPPVCSKKRLCRTDMRTSQLSLEIDPQKNDISNIFLQPRSGDQSPTTALAKLSFDVQKGSNNAEECSPPVSADFKPNFTRSKSCYGDWLRDRDETVFEKKAKEFNLATASKVLSPVKEIKCDALISEISTGRSECTFKSKGSIRQRVRSYHGSTEDKLFNSLSHFSVEKHVASDPEERFSIQTLSHQAFTANTKVLQLSKSNEHQTRKNRLSPHKVLEQKKYQTGVEEKSLETIHSRFTEWGSKSVFHFSIDKSTEMCPKKEKTEQTSSSHPSFHQKTSLHPFAFNANAFKRSDSAATSGFGSESSDCTDTISEIGKKQSFKLDIDIEDLEDDVVFKGTKQRAKQPNEHAHDRTFFPLLLPESSTSLWSTSLESPLSPSESHLLEDMEKIIDKKETSSPCIAGYPSEDTDSFHDSGLPMSPAWVWPRKRVADFDNKCPPAESSLPTRDKRKYEPVTEPLFSNQTQFRTLWYPDDGPHLSKRKNECTFENAFPPCSSGDKIGLYRVQSCPGILSHASSLCGLADQSKQLPSKTFRKGSCFYSEVPQKEIIFHESCPDVLHLPDLDSSQMGQFNREREIRRNVRVIQVS